MEKRNEIPKKRNGAAQISIISLQTLRNNLVKQGHEKTGSVSKKRQEVRGERPQKI
jgi:hypothetical protein